MNEPVEDRVGERRVLQPGVPVFQWQLAGNDRGARANAIVEHFEQIVSGTLIEVLQAPVVEQEDVHLGELREPPRVNQRKVVTVCEAKTSLRRCASTGKRKTAANSSA